MESVKWGSAQAVQAFIEVMHYEITTALAGRQALELQWRKWLVQYRAPVREGRKSIPFEGASDLEVPVTATDVDQYYAKFMQSLHADPDFWQLSTDNPKWVASVKPLQDFLSVLNRTVINMWAVDRRAILECVKLGTAIYEHGWTYERRPTNVYDVDGRIMRVDKVVSKPFVDHVRLPDFLLPNYSYAIEPDEQGGAPWVARRREVTRERLLAMADSTEPYLPNIGKQAALDIIAWETAMQTPMDATIQDLDYQKQGVRSDPALDTNEAGETAVGGSQGIGLQRKIELWEVYARWDVTETDGFQGTKTTPSDIVALIHLPTRKVLRTIYQPYHHGKRPFEVIRFFPGDGFYGIGVCEQDEIYQKAISELTNNLFDNTLLGNSTMIGAKAGANIAPGEPIYPTKVWITDGNPNEEIQVMRMGNGQYPGIMDAIGLMDNQKNRRSGIGDLQMGNIDGLPGRTTATTVQSLLAEGNRRPDLTLKDMRLDGLSKIGLRMIQYLQQFASSPVDLDGKRYFEIAFQALGEQDGAEVAKVLVPMENPELGLGVEIAAASATQNRDMQRQQLTGLVTMVGQAYQGMVQMMQMAQQAQGTPVGMLALKAVEAQSVLLERTLEQYDVPDSESLAPSPQELAPQAAGVPAGALPGSGGAGGPMGGDAGIPGAPPMQ